MRFHSRFESSLDWACAKYMQDEGGGLCSLHRPLLFALLRNPSNLTFNISTMNFRWNIFLIRSDAIIGSILWRQERRQRCWWLVLLFLYCCWLLLLLRPLSSPFLISVASPLYSCVRNKVSRTEQSLVRQQSYTIVAAPTLATDIDDGDCDDGIRIGTP